MQPFCSRQNVQFTWWRRAQTFESLTATATDHYVYHENISKTNDGSFKKLRIKGKVVPVYACSDLGERCPVKTLDTYLSKLPPKAHVDDIFYLRPLSKIPTDHSLGKAL